jgi:hypothetical protein
MILQLPSLHDFTRSSDGAIPFRNAAFDTSSNLYGTAVSGGRSIQSGYFKN